MSQWAEDGYPTKCQKTKKPIGKKRAFQYKIVAMENLLKGTALRTLHLSAWDQKGLGDARGLFCNIQTLTLSNCYNLSDLNGLHASKLRKLLLINCPHLTNISGLNDSHTLHTLSVKGCYSDILTGFGVTSLHTLELLEHKEGRCLDMQQLSHLCNLSVLTIQMELGAQLDVHLMDSSNSLQTLKLDGAYMMGITVSDLECLKSYPCLHTLDLHYLSDSECLSTSVLGECPSLHTLRITEVYIKNLVGLEKCPNLHTLELKSIYDLDSLSSLGESSSLHTLRLMHCHSSVHVIDISGLGICASLHTLQLRDSLCSDISVVLHESTSLTHLAVDFDYAITSECSICTLEVDGEGKRGFWTSFICSKMCVDLGKMANEFTPKLHTIKCHEIFALMAGVEKCPNLRTLRMSNCTIGNDSVLRACKKITFCLKNCKYMS